MCQSPFTAAPADPTADASAPTNPPPALALPLAFGAWPPACLCVRSAFFLHWGKESCFSFCSRSVPARGPLFRVGCGSLGKERRWPRAFPVPGRSCHSRQLPCSALAHQGRISRLPSSASPLVVCVLLCLPWPLNLSPPAPFCPPVLCHQVLLTLRPRHPLTPPSAPWLLASYTLFFAGFPVHGVRGAPPRRPHSTPLPARPAGRPHLPAPAQTRLRPGQLVGLPRVDTWLTQGSAHCLGPSPRRPCSPGPGQGQGQEGARN